MRQELLAPAGSLETFYAVIAAGADAVYLGGPKFGARAYAKNFTQEECIDAIHYAHLKGVKVYMTVNTLVKNHELAECISSLKPYYEAGLDGVIVQDVGVLYALGQAYPKMELHASTQMSISNKWGALLLKKFGVTRVVPSRELSLEEIKRIRTEADIEVETFIHGALCYSYSGQCLLSSIIGGRSGNRGRCAQPCRLPYELLDANMKPLSKSGTLLSLKDLAMLENLPDLANIPVDSLKIEGRMKQTEYAYTVVSLYRKYLDICEECSDVSKLQDVYKVSKADYDKLLDSGNREGFTGGYYYTRNDETMITKGSSAHSSQTDEGLPKDIVMPIKEVVEGKLHVSAGQPLRLEIIYKGNCYIFEGPIAEEALNKPTTAEQMIKQMNKTGNSYFKFSKLDIIGDDNVFLPVSTLNEFRRNCLDELLKTVLAEYIRTDEQSREYNKTSAYPTKSNSSLSVSGILRNRLEEIISEAGLDRVYLDLDEYLLPLEKEQLLNDVRKIKEKQIECYGAFPYVFRHSFEQGLEEIWEELHMSLDGCLVRSIDSLGYVLEKNSNSKKLPIVTDEMLYTYSDVATNVYKDLGIEMCTVPYELNKKELLHHENANSEMLVYGKFPVMITANCVKKTCHMCKKGRNVKRKEILYLKDRKNARFPVETNCNNCGNVIYNSVPLFLLDQDLEELKLGGLRLHFTDENSEQVKEIFRIYHQYLANIDNTRNNKASYNTNEIHNLKGGTAYTHGHYKRGVE